MKPARLGLAFTALLFLIYACKPSYQTNSTAQGRNPVLFQIAGEQVTAEEFLYVYNKNNTSEGNSFSEKQLREYLELFINFKLKVAEARRLGYDTLPEVKAEFEEYKQQLARPYMTETSVTNRMVKEAYQRLAEEISASHLLVALAPDARPDDTLAAFRKIAELRKKAVAGEDFASLALAHSDDPSVRQNKGFLGYFTALQMVYQFEEAAFRTAKGQISEIVRTQFGYHIIKVHERRPSNGSIKVAHLVVRLNPEMNAADSVVAYDKIRAIRQQLEQGTPWDTLCRQFSEDLATRENGGELQWFSAGNMIAPFEEAAFGLAKPGDITGPVLTPYGWHLIKLIERKGLPPFEELEPVLKQKVARDSRAQLNQKYLLQRLRKENNFNENAKVKALLPAKINKSLLEGAWSYNRADPDLGKTLFSIGQRRYPLRDFLAYLELNQPSANDQIKNQEQFVANQYLSFTDASLLEYEEANLPAKYPEYRYLLNEYREGILLFRVMEENVWTKAISDADGLRRFFESHTERYQWRDRARAAVYSCATETLLKQLIEELAKDYHLNDVYSFREVRFAVSSLSPDNKVNEVLNQIAALLQSDKSLIVELNGYHTEAEKADLVSKRTRLLKGLLQAQGIAPERIAEKNTGMGKPQQLMGYSGGGVRFAIYSPAKSVLLQKLNKGNALNVSFTQGNFQRGENTVLDMVTWQQGGHTVNHNDRFHYVYIEQVEAARAKTLDEARGQVIADYQQYLEQQWIEQLRQRYTYSVSEAEFKKLIKVSQ